MLDFLCEICQERKASGSVGSMETNDSWYVCSFCYHHVLEMKPLTVTVFPESVYTSDFREWQRNLKRTYIDIGKKRLQELKDYANSKMH
jgi:hypothetical protein